MSGTAHGTIKKAITFERKKGTQYVKKYQAAPHSRTTGQDIRRRRFKIASIVWRALTRIQKLLWARFLNIGPAGANAPFNKIQLNTGYPCREMPDLPGSPYRRKVEFIIGLAKTGITPMGITEMQV